MVVKNGGLFVLYVLIYFDYGNMNCTNCTIFKRNFKLQTSNLKEMARENRKSEIRKDGNFTAENAKSAARRLAEKIRNPKSERLKTSVKDRPYQ
jgi:hypothetical protein